MTAIGTIRRNCAAITLATFLGGVANATPITVNQFGLELINVGANSAGVAPGPVFRVGGLGVTPNFAGGTTGVATAPTGPHPLSNTGSPNDLTVRIPYQSNLLGSWNIAFSNPSYAPNQRTLGTLGLTAPLPFVKTIMFSGTNANPSFSWASPALPPGGAINGYTLAIYDKSVSSAFPVA